MNIQIQLYVNRVSIKVHHPLIYLPKCFQIQNDDVESMIVKWTLHISDHQDEILLQYDWELMPFNVIQIIGHFQVAFSRQLSKVTEDKENQKAHQCRNEMGVHVEIDVLGMLKCTKNATIWMNEFWQKSKWVVEEITHKIELKNYQGQDQHVEDQIESEKW